MMLEFTGLLGTKIAEHDLLRSSEQNKHFTLIQDLEWNIKETTYCSVAIFLVQVLFIKELRMFEVLDF